MKTISQNKSMRPLAILILFSMVCSGCSTVHVEDINVRKAEFKISSIPKVWPGYGTDTSRLREKDIYDRVSENWYRDIVRGHGSVLWEERNTCRQEVRADINKE